MQRLIILVCLSIVFLSCEKSSEEKRKEIQENNIENSAYTKELKADSLKNRAEELDKEANSLKEEADKLRDSARKM